MKIANIIKTLKKDGFKVVKGEFDFQECWMCNGTALIDWVDGKVKETTARYSDVLNQVTHNVSHIYTLEKGKKVLTKNKKMGYE